MADGEQSPTFTTVGPSQGADSLADAMKSIQDSMGSIVRLSEQLKNNLGDTQTSAQYVSGGLGLAPVSGGPGATQHTTGIAQPTAMVSRGAMGIVTAPLGHGGGFANRAVNAMSHQIGSSRANAAVYGANAMISMADKTVITQEAALSNEFQRYTAGAMGSDFDRVKKSAFNVSNYGLSESDVRQATMNAISSGALQQGFNLNEAANIASAMGMSHSQASAAMQGMAEPENVYNLAAIGVQAINPDGSRRGQADMANQMYDRFYQGRTDINKDDVLESFNPQYGNIYRSLSRAGMTDEQIQIQKRLMLGRVDNGGKPLTEASVEGLTDELPRGYKAGQEAAATEGRLVEEMTNEVTGAFELATEAVTDFQTGMLEVNAGVVEAANAFKTFDDVAKKAGFKNAATLTAGGLTMGAAGSDNSNLFSSDAANTPFGWLGALFGSAEGTWNVEKDQAANVHQGEMILPSRTARAVRENLGIGTVDSGQVATAIRTELGVGQVGNHTGPRKGGGGGDVYINLTIQRATDAEAMAFARKIKDILDGDKELAGLGLGQVAL